MSEVRVPVRVLPSGKVYRQMFDAEVQLVKSLHASKAKDLHLPKLTDSWSGDKQASAASSGNILTDRQRTWTAGMPNDYTTENPVVYRHTATDHAIRLQEAGPNPEARLVQGLLTDLPPPKKQASDIIARISEKRKQKHEVTVEKMQEDLCAISNRTEPRIVEIGQSLLKKIAEDDLKIKAIFEEIKSDDVLVNYSYEDLENVWSRIESHSPERAEWIAQCDTSFAVIENERLEALKGVFRKYAALLEKIAYLMPQDVHRYMEKESMMANQSILVNRRAFEKLRINLVESDIQREMMQHLTWHERVQDWKKLNSEIAVKLFSEFMESFEITEPPDVEEELQKHLEKQTELREKRNEILEELRQFKPPSSTKALVYKWNSDLAKAQENIDQLNLKILRVLNEKYEVVCQRCLTEIDKYRKNLVLSKVCSDEDMQRIVNEHMLPLVGQRQREFEKRLEQMDQIFESLAIRTEHQLKRLFKFTQGAAHMWDVHEIGLAKQERRLQDDLDESRQTHDVENQERESKLDIVMDRLRQESTEDALAMFLGKSLEILDFIYEGYEGFHEEQMTIVSGYPDLVKVEVQRYDDALCQFFNVDRKKPEEKPPSPEKVVPPRKGSLNIPRLKAQDPRRRHSAPLTNRRRYSESRSPSPKRGPGTPTQAKVLRKTLATEKGTLFYVITAADMEDFEEDGEKPPKVEVETSDDDDAPQTGRKIAALAGTAFLTEVSDTSGITEMPDYIKTIYLETSLMRDLKKHVRMQFLNHLEEWGGKSLTKAETFARDKKEELASELDLRKHLHEPRAKRIEVDVHNVRAAELVFHKERVQRHCKGITAALVGLKQDFDETTKKQDVQAAEFRSTIEGMESVFVNATKSTRLVELTNSLHENLDSYMEIVKASLRSFRQTLDNTLGRLRDSNAQCLKSFKLFSQGGNFSPDETVGLRRKLEKMAQRIDIAEGAIMRDLEGMESKRLDQGTEVITKFEDRFRNHMIDLTFMEKVQRWITNCQVRIKTEVAQCNGLAANIARHVNLVKSRIDACKHPNFDKEEISPEFLRKYMNEVMGVLHSRADYLSCKINVLLDETALQSDMDLEKTQESAASGQGGLTPVPSSRQKSRQTASRGSRQAQLKPTPPSVATPSRTDLQTGGQSRRGQVQEDAAIGTIKSILRAQKVIDPESEDMRSVRQPPSTAASQVGTARMRKGSFRRQGTLTSITSSAVESERSRRGSNSMGSAYKRRDTKFDPRCMVFGTKPTIGTNFESKIRQILYETLDGLLSTGELYYKQKGGRLTTRPEQMQENFEAFTDVVIAKLLNYEEQTKEYHNTSLQGFRQQLKTLEEDLAEVPQLILDEILKMTLQNLQNEQQRLQADFLTKETIWQQRKEFHKTSLRPTMGHPDQQSNLEALMSQEEERQKENLDGIQRNSLILGNSAHEVAKQFLQTVSQNCTDLLLQFDNLLTIDDVKSGKIEIQKEPTEVLIRKKAAGIDLHDTSYKPSLPRGAKAWPGLDASHFVKGKELSGVTEETNSLQTTLGHTATVEKRDRCLASFTKAYDAVMENVRQQEFLQMHSEERWAENWEQSIKNVRQLYM